MPTKMPTAKPARYEFRIFGDDCREIAARIQRDATKQGTDQSEDIYILAAAVDDQNCKIRDGHLEVKTRLAEEADLEQWQPTLNQAFPVQTAWLRDVLFPALQLSVARWGRPHYTEEQFLDEVVAAHPALHALAITKQRRLFALNDCRIEVGEVQVAAQLPIFTIALESEEPERVREVQVQLGLQNYANTNYVQRLKALLQVGESH